jgi:hypothetical protein
VTGFPAKSREAVWVFNPVTTKLREFRLLKSAQ